MAPIKNLGVVVTSILSRFIRNHIRALRGVGSWTPSVFCLMAPVSRAGLGPRMRDEYGTITEWWLVGGRKLENKQFQSNYNWHESLSAHWILSAVRSGSILVVFKVRPQNNCRHARREKSLLKAGMMDPPPWRKHVTPRGWEKVLSMPYGETCVDWKPKWLIVYIYI